MIVVKYDVNKLNNQQNTVKHNNGITKQHIEDSDSKLLHIEKMIKAKKNLLLSKQEKLEKISKNNHFLNEIKNDYQEYYNYIKKQKEEQILALNMLNEYIKDLSLSGELSKHNINDSKYEQKKILNEINSIKEGLKSIMQNTNNL
jgi:hypothetical protein